MKYTTLNEILKYNPCGQKTNGETGFSKLRKHLGKTKSDNKQISFIDILDSNGIVDAIWCLRVLPDYDLDVMKFKLLCAERVEHLDKSGSAKKALDILRKFIAGDIGKESLSACAASASSYASAAIAERKFQEQLFIEIFGG